MPLYNEQTTTETITTTTFDRAYRITVNYPNKAIPSITFDEEKIERKGGRDTSLGRIGEVSEQFTEDNALTSFNLLDSETGEVTGTATYNDVFQLLYGLYFHLATKRDNEK